MVDRNRSRTITASMQCHCERSEAISNRTISEMRSYSGMISFVPGRIVFASWIVPRLASKIFRHWPGDP